MSLRLLSFNLLDFFEPALEAHRAITAAKLAHVAAKLREADADVVALQELGADTMLERLLDGAVPELGYRHRLLGPADQRGIRCGIVSRLPLVETTLHVAESIPFPRLVDVDPEPFAGRIPLRRGLVHARVEAGALGPVDVITLHFKSKLPTRMKTADGEEITDRSPTGLAEARLRSLVLRSAEALHLRRLLDAMLVEPERAIAVLGDFNDTIDSLPLQILRADDPWLPSATRMFDAFAGLEPSARRSVLHRGQPEQIDHVLVSERLASSIVEARILNDDLRDHGPFRPDAPPEPDSDHAPVYVRLSASR
jgi:endonuclease/exonuclease/phosphatase family metal-dependent hydrolase